MPAFNFPSTSTALRILSDSPPIHSPPILPTVPGPLIPALQDPIVSLGIPNAPVPPLTHSVNFLEDLTSSLDPTSINAHNVHMHALHISPPVTTRNTMVEPDSTFSSTTSGNFSAHITTRLPSGADTSTIITFDAPGTYQTTLPSAHIHYITSPHSQDTPTTSAPPYTPAQIHHLSFPSIITAFLPHTSTSTSQPPTNASATTTAITASESILVNAMFSRTAVITWLSLFFAFLFFASLVFALQKVMRRVRARRWLAEREVEYSIRADAIRARLDGDGDGDDDSDWPSTLVGGDGACEFIDGNDIVDANVADGVDPRSGSWSRRRDTRSWLWPGGSGRMGLL
ncbi:hypothetical protein TWF696_007359 [Orbilia brochopaga]|uniref:Uncharacterized protein n=1 Tax=Orbilia brochopaga TaxID=3140254 RepID=A0AAV9UV00_9PEZI